MQREDEARVHCGDCLEVLKELPRGSVNLVYLDPPFFSQKSHTLRTRDRQTEFSFDDVWNSNRDYCRFLEDRLAEIYRVLADNGALFFHCDRHATHLIRLLLDHAFGTDQFRSEIIWTYRRWSNARRGLLPAHQTIYYYTKSDDFTFHTIREDYSPSTNVDQILQQRVRDEYGKSVYKRDDSGEVMANGAKKGVPLGDVWDIPFLNPKARERTGYPTQKPLFLLERIIQLATTEGDVVLDPFCGSGTTLVAAQLLSRRAIGIDVSQDAVTLTKNRLANPVRSESNLLIRGRESYRNADQAALALLEGLDVVPVQRNSGIDAFLRDDCHGKPVPLRVQRRGETIVEAAKKLYQASRNKDIEIMFLVAIARGDQVPLTDELPPGVVVVDAPALGVERCLHACQRGDGKQAPNEPLDTTCPGGG